MWYKKMRIEYNYKLVGSNKCWEYKYVIGK